MTLAIDREAIIKIVYGGKLGWIPNDTHMAPYGEDFLKKKAIRDVAKAKSLLAAAGYADGIKLPTLYYSRYYPEIDRIFQVAAESVKEAGITGNRPHLPGRRGIGQGSRHHHAHRRAAVVGLPEMACRR